MDVRGTLSPKLNAPRALCLRRFRPGERIAVWAYNLPEWVMLEFGAGLAGHGSGHRQSRLSGQRSRICAEAIPLGRPCWWSTHSGAIRCWTRLARYRRDARNCARSSASTTGRPSLPPATTEHRAPGRQTERSRDDPVHVGHDRLSERRAAESSRSCKQWLPTSPSEWASMPGDVFVTTMPLFHTGGCVCCVIGAVSSAATQVLLEAFEPGLVLEMFRGLSRQRDDRGPDHAGGDAGTSLVRDDGSFVGQGDLFGRLDRTGRAGAHGSRKNSAHPSPSCSARPNARRWRR